MTCPVCSERPTRYRSTGECSRCYNRRYAAENREKVRAYHDRWQRERRATLTDRSHEMPSWDLSAPIAYSTAHDRVAYWRGRASDYACPCGAPATEWAYKGDSAYEQTAPVPMYRGSGVIEVGYSPDPMDYAPLCRSCHVTYDRARAKRARAAG